MIQDRNSLPVHPGLVIRFLIVRTLYPTQESIRNCHFSIRYSTTLQSPTHNSLTRHLTTRYSPTHDAATHNSLTDTSPSYHSPTFKMPTRYSPIQNSPTWYSPTYILQLNLATRFSPTCNSLLDNTRQLTTLCLQIRYSPTCFCQFITRQIGNI